MSKNVDFHLDENKPHDAYVGEKPYIFISYAHKDRDLVFPEIRKFQDEGYPIWYDNGLTPGQEWDEIIEEKLENCSLLVAFISNNSMASKNVVDEISLALQESTNINIIPIHLEKTEYAMGLKLRLSRKHSIYKYLATEEDYIKDCFEAFDYYEIPILKKPCSSQLYEGDDDYIFINYSHKDSDIICPEIKRFNDQGYNVWYSDDINLGDEWEENMVKHFHKASIFVVFMTSNSINLSGINHRIFSALNRFPIILIYLEDIDKLHKLMDIKIREYELDKIHEIDKSSLTEKEYVDQYSNIFEKHNLLPK